MTGQNNHLQEGELSHDQYEQVGRNTMTQLKSHTKHVKQIKYHKQ